MRKWIKIGLFIGTLIGIIGTAITRLTGDISLISIPIVILFRSYGLLFAYPLFELLITVAFYSIIGGIAGYLLEKKTMPKILFLSFMLLFIWSYASSPGYAADSRGSITISIPPPSDIVNHSDTHSKSRSSTLATNQGIENFPSMEIRVANITNGKETTLWSSKVNNPGDLKIPLEDGAYKLYVQREGSNTILEYNNNSEGYIIDPQSDKVIPLYNNIWEGYLLDAPWRIENSEINIPIIAIDNDGLTRPGINNISLYDHNDNDRYIASTNWTTLQPIDTNDIPFFHMFMINKNSFLNINNYISIKVKFDLDQSFDNWEGPVNVNIPQFNAPSLADWYSGDMHLHTNYTNNILEFAAPINETRAINKALGLDWIGISDHSFDLDPFKWSERRNDIDLNSDRLFRILEGEEVSC